MLEVGLLSPPTVTVRVHFDCHSFLCLAILDLVDCSVGALADNVCLAQHESRLGEHLEYIYAQLLLLHFK